MVVGMVDVGEQTGAMPEMLNKIADNYDEEVDNAVSAMTSLLEPILIVVLGVIVGCIVVALFLPIIPGWTECQMGGRMVKCEAYLFNDTLRPENYFSSMPSALKRFLAASKRLCLSWLAAW